MAKFIDSFHNLEIDAEDRLEAARKLRLLLPKQPFVCEYSYEMALLKELTEHDIKMMT